MSDSIAEAMTDNEALREILGEVRGIEALLKGQYDDIEGAEDIALTDTESSVRTARTLAVKTVVTNTGTQDIWVYEDGSVVKYLEPKQSWESALSGGGAITAKAIAGQTSTCAVTTYLKDA
jgi:hypothetical protein